MDGAMSYHVSCADEISTPIEETLWRRKTAPTEASVSGNGFDSGDGQQARLLAALHSLRDGDFSVRLPSEWIGVQGKLADAFNDIASPTIAWRGEWSVSAASSARKEKFRQRARFSNAAGAWRTMEESINNLLNDLVWPTTEVTRTIGAVAKGDLTQTMALEVDAHPLQGEFLRSAKLVNTMIGQLAVFTAEVTRVAREVGSEGKLGGQAQVKGVSGAWKDLTDSVNSMANNLTGQVAQHLRSHHRRRPPGTCRARSPSTYAARSFSSRKPSTRWSISLRSFASEVTRVAREVGTEGKLGGQAVVPGVAGTWKDLTDNVNAMASNLTTQVRNIAEVTTAVARGDLSRKITVDVKGEILELKNTINTMVDQLNALAAEVTRVAREVGTEGKLGGQAEVPGVAGTLERSHRQRQLDGLQPDRPGTQHREVSTAIANGNWRARFTVDAKGEILQVKNTMNTMVDQLTPSPPR